MDIRKVYKYKRFWVMLGVFFLIFVFLGIENVEAVNSPVLTFTVDPTVISSGESAVLTWFGTDITGCRGYGDWSESFGASDQLVVGTWGVRPTNTSTYGLSCVGEGGVVRREVTLTVGTQSPPSYVYPTVGSTPGGSVSPTPPPVLTQYSFTAGCAVSKTSASVGEKITFVGSYVGASGSATYSWSGDISGSGKILDYIFSSSGTKTAKLTVTDTADQSRTAYCAVDVSNANPALETAPGGNVLGTVAEKPRENVTPKTDESKSEDKACVCSAGDGDVSLSDTEIAAVGRAQSFVLWFVVALVIINFGFLFYISGRLNKLEKKYSNEVPV